MPSKFAAFFLELQLRKLSLANGPGQASTNGQEGTVHGNPFGSLGPNVGNGRPLSNNSAPSNHSAPNNPSPPSNIPPSKSSTPRSDVCNCNSHYHLIESHDISEVWTARYHMPLSYWYSDEDEYTMPPEFGFPKEWPPRKPQGMGFLEFCGKVQQEHYNRNDQQEIWRQQCRAEYRRAVYQDFKKESRTLNDFMHWVETDNQQEYENKLSIQKTIMNNVGSEGRQKREIIQTQRKWEWRKGQEFVRWTEHRRKTSQAFMEWVAEFDQKEDRLHLNNMPYGYEVYRSNIEAQRQEHWQSFEKNEENQQKQEWERKCREREAAVQKAIAAEQKKHDAMIRRTFQEQVEKNAAANNVQPAQQPFQIRPKSPGNLAKFCFPSCPLCRLRDEDQCQCYQTCIDH